MARRMLKRGVLFVIEGIDGSGKTTQAKRLVETLSRRGYDAVYLREPTDGPSGAEIRRAAQDGTRQGDPEKEYRLFMLDRKENVADSIHPALSAGRVVVLDRYYFSTMAYQGALGLDPERIRRENEGFAPVPDRVFYLSMTVEEGLKRISRNRGSFTSFEKAEYLEKVKAIFDERVASLPYTVIIDGMNGQDDISDEIRTGALAFLESVTKQPGP